MLRQAMGEVTIPGYRDLQRIGHGGFSTVYRAYQERFERTVALKVLSVQFTEERVRRGFLRELRLTSRLTGHPNVVTVLDYGVTGTGQPYIAMEYFERGSLRDLLTARGPLPLSDVQRIGVKIAAALGAAHQEGIIHRDVKPQNILLSRYGEPALADFGTARMTTAPELSSRSDALTPVHAAPEILQGQTPSPACDVYSLGSTLYQLLAGRAPYESGDDGIAGLLLRMLSQEPPQLDRPDIPPEMVELIRRAMARNPAHRFRDGRAFADALQVAIGVPPPDPAPPPQAGTQRAEDDTVRLGTARRRRRWSVAAAVLTVVIATATSLGLSAKPGRTSDHTAALGSARRATPTPSTQSTGQTRSTGLAASGQSAGASTVPNHPPVAPTVSITGVSSDVTSVIVQFTVDGHGLSIVDCVASVAGGGQAHGDCTRLTVGGLLAGSTARITVSARSTAGTGSATANATTQQLYGTVRCNAAGTADPTACDNGVRVFSGPSQTATMLRSVYNGQRFAAVCKANGDEVYAYVYNNGKRSTWWIVLAGGGYLPYAWFNLDGADNLSLIRPC